MTYTHTRKEQVTLLLKCHHSLSSKSLTNIPWAVRLIELENAVFMSSTFGG